MKLTRKEAQRQLAFLMAMQKLDRVLNGTGKAKRSVKAQKAKAAA